MPGMLRNALLWLAVIAIGAGKASVGHAADAGVASAAIGMQTLHVLVTAVWGGLAMAAGLAVLPALGTSTARGMLIRTATQVPNVSVVAVGLVLLSGIFNAVRESGGSLEAIELSTWGHVLTLKLVLVALALVLGGLNRFLGAAASAPHRIDDGCAYLRQCVVSGSTGDDWCVCRGGRTVA